MPCSRWNAGAFRGLRGTDRAAVLLERGGNTAFPAERCTDRYSRSGIPPTSPVNVQSVNLPDTCKISWDRPENENGIIRNYTVYYSAYPRPMSDDTPIDQDNSGMYDINNGSQMTFTFKKSEHAPYSEYQFNISATTVSTGNSSDVGNGSCITPPAAPAEGSVRRPVAGEPVSPDREAITSTTFYMAVAPADERNGPISCYDIIVKELLENEDISTLDPDRDFPQDQVGTYGDAQVTPGRAYVAFVKQGSLVYSTVNVKIGSQRASRCGGVASSRRKRQAVYDHTGNNGQLKSDTRYTAFVRAFVKVGDGMEEVYTSSPFMQPITTVAQPDNTVVIAVVFAVGLGTAFLITLTARGVRVWRKKRRTNHSRPETTAMEMDSIDYDDVSLPEDGMASAVYEDVGLPSWALRWEILWKNLVVDDKVLGQGNFGEVRSGTVNIGGRMTKTAIKVLKGHASKTDREDFMEEFRTMTNIGYHPNVVSLLGACQHEDVLYVALEYLPNGDLRSYLRTARSQSESDEGALSSEMLIKFALDVAKGMNHLSVSGVIHRDLAARNILLGEQLVAKVSDFGLSRGEDTYVQTSTRRVPTRWLAIESLLDRTYTTQSDVWSFGILLWEIASIGGTPYPAIATRSLVGRLMEGYRMTKPANCDEQIYSLMLRCWEEDPSNRPSFSDLIHILSKMDDNKIEHTYMAIDRAHYENFCVIRPELDDN
ncbi:tyrosine-protein kinase receptor Tie-1-like [Patiria miniata]|uniref:receptor protein-tyrosine kinase n=1 Tax=Patiria miniata TaxID=46514 RepID=A0A914ASG6_PATMI|nr:tyrosine-protein kinase receptor Tie-1-like [Patiria miniata]